MALIKYYDSREEPEYQLREDHRKSVLRQMWINSAIAGGNALVCLLFALVTFPMVIAVPVSIITWIVIIVTFIRIFTLNAKLKRGAKA